MEGLVVKTSPQVLQNNTAARPSPKKWAALPKELVEWIVSFLHPEEFARTMEVCKNWTITRIEKNQSKVLNKVVKQFQEIFIKKFGALTSRETRLSYANFGAFYRRELHAFESIYHNASVTWEGWSKIPLPFHMRLLFIRYQIVGIEKKGLPVVHSITEKKPSDFWGILSLHTMEKIYALVEASLTKGRETLKDFEDNPSFSLIEIRNRAKRLDHIDGISWRLSRIARFNQKVLSEKIEIFKLGSVVLGASALILALITHSFPATAFSVIGFISLRLFVWYMNSRKSMQFDFSLHEIREYFVDLGQTNAGNVRIGDTIFPIFMEYVQRGTIAGTLSGEAFIFRIEREGEIGLQFDDSFPNKLWIKNLSVQNMEALKFKQALIQISLKIFKHSEADILVYAGSEQDPHFLDAGFKADNGFLSLSKWED